MTIELPDDLVARIDRLTDDRDAFVAEAIHDHLRGTSRSRADDETARIDEIAEELNREAVDVLEYQVIP